MEISVDENIKELLWSLEGNQRSKTLTYEAEYAHSKDHIKMTKLL